MKSLEAIGVKRTPDTSPSPLWASQFVGVTTMAIKALLYAGLIWCIATQGSIFLCSLLVLLLAFLDFAIWNAIRIVQTWHQRPILRTVVSRHPEKEKIEKILSEYSHIYAQCEHLCRMVKESFFISEANGVVPNGPIPSNQLVEIDEATDFRVRLTATQMRDILMSPQEELSGCSWPETFRTSLKMVKDRAEKMNGAPATVALTGGGARMRFVRELCQSVFPEAVTLIDSSPEFTIAKGLARAGKLDLLSTSFFQELGPLRDALLDSLKKTRFSFIEASVGPMAEDFVAKVVRKGLISWREGQVSSLNDLANHLRVQGECWAKSPSAECIVREATNAWSQRAMLDIAPRIRDVSHRYGLPYDSLKMDIAPVQDRRSLCLLFA